MADKIYTAEWSLCRQAWEMHEIGVLSETAHEIKTTLPHPFNRHVPANICRTPAAAWRKAREEVVKEIASLRAKLASQQRRLDALPGEEG